VAVRLPKFKLTVVPATGAAGVHFPAVLQATVPPEDIASVVHVEEV